MNRVFLINECNEGYTIVVKYRYCSMISAVAAAASSLSSVPFQSDLWGMARS